MSEQLENFFNSLTTNKVIYIIAGTGIIVFFNALYNGFVWDDKSYIIYNSALHANFFTKANPFNSLGQYRPIGAFYFSILNYLFGNSAFFYHLLQIIIHIVNAALVFFLFKKYFNKTLALGISLIFLVHPVVVESVSYIAAAIVPLSFLFGIIALLLINEKKEADLKRMALIFLFLLLSILARETGIIFLILVLMNILIFGKKRIPLFFIFTAGTIFSYVTLRFVIAKSFLIQADLVPIAKFDFLERMINVPAIIFYYLKTFFFPIELAIDQHWVITAIDFRSFYLPLLSGLAVFSMVILFGISLLKTNKNSFKVFLFFFLWFALGLGMHSQIIPLDMTVADRFFYFPMVGLLGMMAVAIQSVKQYPENVKKIGSIVAIIFLIFLAGRTMARNANWYDPIILYTHDIKTEDNFDIENNLGVELQLAGRNNEALDHFKKSVDLYPFETNCSNLGRTYQKVGELDKAVFYGYKAFNEKHYSYSQPSHDHDEKTYESLAFALLLSKRYEEAAKFLDTAVIDYPDSVILWTLLADSEYELHDQEKAVFAATKALNLSPNNQTNYVYTQIKNEQPIQLVP